MVVAWRCSDCSWNLNLALVSPRPLASPGLNGLLPLVDTSGRVLDTGTCIFNIFHLFIPSLTPFSRAIIMHLRPQKV